jgi:beta-RFAP synthase
MEIREAPKPHVGLGTGTQLALSVARALLTLFGRSDAEATELALAARRGQRSAIGTHGFARGGLIFEQGKQPHESISPLAERIELPDTWRFVLLIPGETEGLSGQEERDAFDRLPAVPTKTTQKLLRIATEEILPAARNAEFDTFSDALYRYGHLAGTCFAPRQFGAFATRETQATVEALRAAGIQGVGQSSWGPTVFALVEDHNSEEALRLANSLVGGDSSQVLLAAPSNRGAIVEVNV